jgi:hypothetical protein
MLCVSVRANLNGSRGRGGREIICFDAGCTHLKADGYSLCRGARLHKTTFEIEYL